MRRSLLVVVFALCVVTAGCSSFHDSPRPEPETTTLTGELAPGLSADGFTNRMELVDAHTRIVRQDSYTLSLRGESRSTGTGWIRYETTYRRGAKSSHYHYRHASNASLKPNTENSYRGAVWSNGSQMLSMRSTENGTRYERTNDSDRRSSRNIAIPPPLEREKLHTLLYALNVTHIERVDTERSGTPLYRVTASELIEPDVLTSRFRFESVRNASLVFTADTWGVVHRYRFEATGTTENETVEVTETMQITDIGRTSISRPPWYSAAIENTSKR